MKFFSITLFLLFGFLSKAQTWQKIQDYPGTARDDGASFTINNKIYCGIGLEVGWTCPNDIYIFDLSSETWTTSTSFPVNQQRQYATSFVINDKGYVFGGINCSNIYLNDLWEYNPINNNWIQKNNLPAIGRSGSVSFVINDTAYIVGGRTATNNAIAETWGYDAVNDSWFQKNDIPNNGVWRGVSFSYNNQGYVGLGKDSLGMFHKIFYAYSPNKNGWATIAGFSHEGKTYTGYTQADSLAYLFGGIDSLDVIDTTFEILNLKNFTIQNSVPFSSTPRKGGMSFCNNHLFYTTTGVSSTTRFNETWKIDLSIGIKEYQNDNSVTVFPNPNNGIFYVSSKKQNITSLKILNTMGESVYENQYKQQFIHLEIPELAKGLYIIHYELNNKLNYNQKLIIK